MEYHMNFKVIRVKERRQAGILNGLRDKLIPGQDFDSQDSFLEQLLRLLESAPELCYFSIAWDCETEDDNELVLMFILAIVRPGTRIIQGLQYWTKGPQPKVCSKMFELFLNWAELEELEEIQMEDLRNPPEELVKMGFRVKTTLYSKKVNQSITISDEVSETDKKEPENGSDSLANDS